MTHNADVLFWEEGTGAQVILTLFLHIQFLEASQVLCDLSFTARHIFLTQETEQ